MSNKKVGILVGSLRRNSYSRQVALTLKSLAPDDLEFEFIELEGLEIYDQDLEDNWKEPESWKAFRRHMQKVDAFLFVTPEYNRGVPALLKNALDVGSRPYGHSVWDGKPGAVVSVSPGALGGFAANHMLRQSFVVLNIPVMQKPEAYIGNVDSLFDEKGELIHDETRMFFSEIIRSFGEWIDRNI